LVWSGSHRGIEVKWEWHLQLWDIEAGAGIERLIGTAASMGHWREACKKQWVVFMELVELRNCIEVSIIWIQDGRVVCAGPLGSWSWNVCSAFKILEENSICDWGAITHSVDIKSVPEGCELAPE
jgi:hypothetical protein